MKTLEQVLSKIKILPLIALIGCGTISSNRTMVYDSYHTSGNHSLGIKESMSVEGENYRAFLPSLALEVEDPIDKRTPIVTEDNIPVLDMVAYRVTNRTFKVSLLTELAYNLFDVCDYNTFIGPICMGLDIGIGAEISVTAVNSWYDLGVYSELLGTGTVHNIQNPIPYLEFNQDFYLSLIGHHDFGPLTSFYQIRVGFEDIHTMLGVGFIWGRITSEKE